MLKDVKPDPRIKIVQSAKEQFEHERDQPHECSQDRMPGPGITAKQEWKNCYGFARFNAKIQKR